MGWSRPDADVPPLPRLPLFGHAAAGPACPLLRDDRTQLKRVPTSVDDPNRTLVSRRTKKEAVRTGLSFEEKLLELDVESEVFLDIGRPFRIVRGTKANPFFIGLFLAPLEPVVAIGAGRITELGASSFDNVLNDFRHFKGRGGRL